jgi:hypothetical protein
MENMLHEARLRRAATPVKLGTPLRGQPSLTVIDCAEQIGFGKNLYEQAAEIHKIFADHPDLKAQFEPKILAGVDEETGHVVGLGGIVAALNYLLKGARKGGPPKTPDKQLDLFEDGFQTIKTRLCYWKQFNLVQKEKAVAAMRDMVNAMPDDVLTELQRAITLAKRAKAETKVSA